MALIEFEEKEIELIINSIKKRQEIFDSNPEFYDKRKKDLQKILSQLDSYFIDLTPLQKALISGCIKDYIDYSNNEFLRLSDYEIFKIRELKFNEFNETDIALIALKKLQDKSNTKRKTLNSILEYINLLLKTEKIYYSILNDGKIYKAAIMISDKKGLRIDMEGALLEDFKFENILGDSYMTYDKPKIVLNKLKTYGEHCDLTKNQRRFLKIIEKACV
ncbi:hypothetical protein ACT3CD_16660 [Geofilum sp. OHC36d9]|uniref:hypothetical protein n=1 Tax=Geofilum sp. OHC36d9 TaxID=3458413 RepID=UPI004033A00B